MMLTVFTPTYNRGNLLKRVYQSLLGQTCKDFEWLIIDDGSTDNTRLVVDQLIKENIIAIRYLYKKNGGKHTAYNIAISEASGDLFLCLDSDDMLTTDAVELINKGRHLLGSLDCGIIAYKQDMSGQLLSTPLRCSEHCGLLGFQRRGVSGEFSLVFKTEIIKRYPFPVFEGERFMGENVLYDKLELDGYTLAPLKYVLECCEYQNNGLSAQFVALVRENPLGYCVYYLQRIDLYGGVMDRIVAAGKYNCFRLIAKEVLPQYTGKHKHIVTVTKLLGMIFYAYYKILKGL